MEQVAFRECGESGRQPGATALLFSFQAPLSLSSTETAPLFAVPDRAMEEAFSARSVEPSYG